MTSPTIELRDLDLEYHGLLGLGTTWANPRADESYFVNSREIGTFREQMQRNAFEDATAGREPVELRRDHAEDSPIFASTVTGSLKLTDRADGLLLTAALRKSDPATQTAVADIRAGRLSGLSVGMRVNSDRWGTWTDGRTALRTVTSASLGEVSLVRRPANPQAVISELRDNRFEYRSVALVPAATSTDTATCPQCGFTGYLDQFADSDSDGRGDKYSAAELASMLKKGHALANAKGDPSYPIEDTDDLRRAVLAVGRSSRPPERVRQHIIKNAKRLGLLSVVPDDWQADGTVKGAGRSAILAINDGYSLRTELAELDHHMSEIDVMIAVAQRRAQRPQEPLSRVEQLHPEELERMRRFEAYARLVA